MKSQLYICGDSFAVPDPDHGPCWVDYLQAQLPAYDIINLARVCASNLLISQQVDQAIALADKIIVLCTASTRSQARQNGQIIPYSIHSLDATTPFNARQLGILRSHTREFFDLDLCIYENKCIIESMLQRLTDSNRPFVWDQGGFEHASYGGTGQYFEKWHSRRSDRNLWDYTITREHRPYYHITDDAVNRAVAVYYAEWCHAPT
jgi:hypothetical protein